MEDIKATYSSVGPVLDRAIKIFGEEAISGRDRLNVGSGGGAIPGWLNIDSSDGQNPDMIVDVDHPLPFPPGRFDVILASHVLEHVRDPMRVVFSLHEVLKPGGRLLVIVPHAWADVGLCNPLHRNYFTHQTFVYFRADTYNQPGTAGYRANEGRPVADWESVKVGLLPVPEWRNHLDLEFAANHYVNVISEVFAVMTKRGA